MFDTQLYIYFNTLIYQSQEFTQNKFHNKIKTSELPRLFCLFTCFRSTIILI